MRARDPKFLTLVVGVLGTMAFLLAVSIKQPGAFAYFHTVDEFLAQHPAEGSRSRVNGKVIEGSIERLPSGQDVKFVIAGGSGQLKVAYHGIVPDTFVDGADVTVEGTLAHGTLEASTLLAKCPSKYEAAASSRENAPAR